MPATRLTNNHRSLLYLLVTQIVDCPAEQKAEHVAYDRALPHATKIVETHYLPADMKVFAKYDRARADKCIRVQMPDGDVKEFKFRQDDAPLVPSGNSCSSRMYLADERPGAAIEKWVDAAKTFADALTKKRQEYADFISNATTFEQILDVWPEAAQVADRIKINLPANVSPEILARIKADSESRMKRAKAA